MPESRHLIRLACCCLKSVTTQPVSSVAAGPPTRTIYALPSGARLVAKSAMSSSYHFVVGSTERSIARATKRGGGRGPVLSRSQSPASLGGYRAVRRSLGLMTSFRRIEAKLISDHDPRTILERELLVRLTSLLGSSAARVRSKPDCCKWRAAFCTHTCGPRSDLGMPSSPRRAHRNVAASMHD